MKEFFPVGATYAPLPKATEVDIAQWPQDIENIAKLGFTVFRAFLCWDRVEKEPGVRDFSRIDFVFDQAARHGLKVIGNVGGTFANLQAIYPPRHLVYDKHCTLHMPRPDSPAELHTNRFKLCYDDPVYQQEAAGFIREAVARYQGHPALLAWSGWNEPRLAECFCPHTVALYRNWLQKKYGSPEAVAQAWSGEFPVRFRSWEDVNPQPTASFEDGGYVPFLDWRDFTAQNRTDKFNLVRQWIREADPATPIISHLCGPRDADIFGEEDILGTSVYTIHDQARRDRDFPPYEFIQFQHLPHIRTGLRSTRRDPEGFWVVETEAGPVSWVHHMAPRSYSPRKMNLRDLYFVAHGARAVLRWLYRSRISDAQAGEFNLVGWDGRITDRARAFGQLGRFLNEHAALFLHHTDDASGVAILEAGDQSNLAEAETYLNRYDAAVTNAYAACCHLGVRPVLCNRRQLLTGELPQLKVLIAPFRPYVDAELAEFFRQFVANGGTLIADSPFATKNRQGIHYEKTPGLLTDVFGAQVWDLEKLYEPTAGGIPALDFKARIECRGCQTDARFSDGEPAIIHHDFGRGRAILHASQLLAAYRLYETEGSYVPTPAAMPQLTFATGEALRRELRRRFADAGIHPAWQFIGADDRCRQHLQIFRRNLPDGGKLLFVLNGDDQPHEFSLAMENLGDYAVLGTAGPDDRAEADGDNVRFHLREWGWAILRRKGEK